MSLTKKKINLLESEEGTRIKQTLQFMVANTAYNTEPSYSANTVVYPNNLIPFVDKHLNYLNSHPSVDIEHYLANLRLMTRIR